MRFENALDHTQNKKLLRKIKILYKGKISVDHQNSGIYTLPTAGKIPYCKYNRRNTLDKKK